MRKDRTFTSLLMELCDYIILTYISNKNGGRTHCIAESNKVFIMNKDKYKNFVLDIWLQYVPL